MEKTYYQAAAQKAQGQAPENIGLKIFPNGKANESDFIAFGGSQMSCDASQKHTKCEPIAFAPDIIYTDSKSQEILTIFDQLLSTLNHTGAQKSADNGADAVSNGWKNYKNDKYGFEFSYPDIYSEKNDPNVKSGQSMELIANFSRGEAGSLIVKIFNNYFKDYKLIDNPGGFTWCFDTAKKIWIACGTDEPAGEYGPQKSQGDMESYIYGSGDITCAWKDIIIPHPTYAYVLQITNTTCGISDETTHDYKQPGYKLDSQEFINKFKFAE